MRGAIRGFERINLSKKRKTFDKRTKSVYTNLAKSEEDAEKHTPLRVNKKEKAKKSDTRH